MTICCCQKCPIKRIDAVHAPSAMQHTIFIVLRCELELRLQVVINSWLLAVAVLACTRSSLSHAAELCAWCC
jgi:hypothetical protein